MFRLLALGALVGALVLSACSDANDAPPAAGTANDSVTTVVEQPAEALEAVDPFAAEPGIDGGTSPLSVFAIDSGDCYVYESAVVRLTRPETEDGDIDMESRPSVALIDRTDANPRDDCDLEPTLDLSAALGGIDRFVSIEDSLAIAVQREGPTVFVHDLAAAETVLEEVYAEPLAVEDGGLLFGAPATPMADMEALEAAGVDCPEAAEIFEREGSVGASIRMRFDFETRETSATDDIRCVELDA